MKLAERGIAAPKRERGGRGEGGATERVQERERRGVLERGDAKRFHPAAHQRQKPKPIRWIKFSDEEAMRVTWISWSDSCPLPDEHGAHNLLGMRACYWPRLMMCSYTYIGSMPSSTRGWENSMLIVCMSGYMKKKKCFDSKHSTCREVTGSTLKSSSTSSISASRLLLPVPTEGIYAALSSRAIQDPTLRTVFTCAPLGRERGNRWATGCRPFSCSAFCPSLVLFTCTDGISLAAQISPNSWSQDTRRSHHRQNSAVVVSCLDVVITHNTAVHQKPS